MKKHLLIYLIIYSICSLAGQVRAQERFADRYNITSVSYTHLTLPTTSRV